MGVLNIIVRWLLRFITRRSLVAAVKSFAPLGCCYPGISDSGHILTKLGVIGGLLCRNENLVMNVGVTAIAPHREV